MKKITTLLIFFVLKSAAQPLISDFENFTLAPNTYYKDTNNLPFSSNYASFMYQWTKGTYPYWSGGFSYTNVKDSTTKSFTNLYGVKALNGYANSDQFVIGQDKGVIKISIPQTTVTGFYVTNTTYAFHSMKDGDSFTRKFGDTLGTGSNTNMPQGSWPDFFKITVKGYNNGALKNDSVEYYLADFRPANKSNDYILRDWQWVNTSTLGEVDSIKFFMYTSVNNQFGPLTPLFFAMDNLTTLSADPSAIGNNNYGTPVSVFPNPFSDRISFGNTPVTSVKITGPLGNTVFSSEEPVDVLELGSLNAGQYLLEFTAEDKVYHKKIIKN